MNEETHGAIERLDRSKPPPGWEWTGLRLIKPWPLGEPGGAPPERAESNADAWTQHEARHDPPGMNLLGGFFCSPRTNPRAANARTAAWAWYWRRLAVTKRLEGEDARRVFEKVDDGCPLPGPAFWPRALTWSNDQAAEVADWLLDSTTEPPEVLRG